MNAKRSILVGGLVGLALSVPTSGQSAASSPCGARGLRAAPGTSGAPGTHGAPSATILRGASRAPRQEAGAASYESGAGGVSYARADDESFPPDARPPRAVLGVGLQDVPPLLAAHLPDEALGGLVLSHVFAGGPAERAGLETYDVVATLDGHGELSVGRVREIIDARGPGASVEVGYFRKGERRTVQVTLEEPRPASRIYRSDRPAPPAGGPATGPPVPGPSASPDDPGPRGYAIGSDGRVFVWPDDGPGYVREIRPEELRSRVAGPDRVGPSPGPGAGERGAAPGEQRLKELESRMRRIEALLERLVEKREDALR
jgi:hypothetical protein